MDNPSIATGALTACEVMFAILQPCAIKPSITDVIPSIGAGMLVSSDPMSFSTDIDIRDTSFSLMDRIDLLGVDGLSAPCG